jgi:hypothetical protein
MTSQADGATFHVGMQKSDYAVTVSTWWDELQIIGGDASTAIAEMEQFVSRAQDALSDLRRTVGEDPPPSCRPDHAEPEELRQGGGGITYRCLSCGAEWFRTIRPGEPVPDGQL